MESIKVRFREIILGVVRGEVGEEGRDYCQQEKSDATDFLPLGNWLEVNYRL